MWKRVVGIVVLACAVLGGTWIYGVHAKVKVSNQDVCREALNTYDLAVEGANHAISESDRQKMLKVAADERQRVDRCMSQK